MSHYLSVLGFATFNPTYWAEAVKLLVPQLAQGEWIRQHLNILILGPTGVGKIFLAPAALADAACRHNFHVHYQRTSRLLHQTALSHTDGSYPKLLDAYARGQLLVLDDWLRRSSDPSHARFPDLTIADAILDRLVTPFGQLGQARMPQAHSVQSPAYS